MDADLERWIRWTRQLSWRKIAWWSHVDLCRLGIETLNLLCALGLPGAEKMDVNYCMKKIGQWAEKVKFYTDQMMHVYERDPGRFSNSIGYFKALCLVTCLQRDCGVRYNPKKRDPQVPLQVADSFVFGIIQGEGGTCASLPVLYCAVGYRLLYPMYLMHATGDSASHFFVRWDDGEIRFNIEASGEGMATPPDDHYRTGRFQLTPEKEKRGWFLKPHNMRHCLARFLAERSHYCLEQSDFKEAVESMTWAAGLLPECEGYLDTAKLFYNQWKDHWAAKKPPGFPEIFVTEIESRRFPPSVPLEFEHRLCGLETLECLLKDPGHDRNLWEPLRRGERPGKVPVEVESRVDKICGKKIRFLFQKKARSPGENANV